MTPAGLAAASWSVWVDTGGTFTDCIARHESGEVRRAKVLSSSALRARVEAVDGREVRYAASWHRPYLADGFARGAELRWLVEYSGLSVVDSRTADRALLLTSAPPRELVGKVFELAFTEEAPVLAARLVTGAVPGERLDVRLRLATTRGTNALLEGRGAPTALFVTRGFADLLRIGDQRRRDLFALDVRRRPMLYSAVVEVEERLAADGTVLRPLALESLRQESLGLLERGVDVAAVALLHSYRQPAHEEELAAFLRELGFRHVSASARLAPVIRIVPRAATAVVNAYLSPTVDEYLRRVEAAVGEDRLQVMTSAGGLVRSSGFEPKDSLLSGPAGGVVGAAAAGRREGLDPLLLFDMGGTSTDVARFASDYQYLFEHAVGDAVVAAPALAIESVAAGGGSLCQARDGEVTVGPESAGAVPGPACYGAGGPLTVSDVNLLLGRLDPRRFGLPLDAAAAEAAAEEEERALRQRLGAQAPGREELLEGFLRIANERMAEAIRHISLRRGYDPREHALVAFGGAGGQHACAIAELLAVRVVVAPRDAGLLSARGLGAAVVERFAQRQVLQPLDSVRGELHRWLDELGAAAVAQVVAEEQSAAEVGVRRYLAFLRFVGQEATVEVSLEELGGTLEGLEGRFIARYTELYGYRPGAREIELESLRVVASSRPPEELSEASSDGGPTGNRQPQAGQVRRMFSAGSWRRAAVYDLTEIHPGQRLDGPALVLDDHATVVVDVGWSARGTAGSLVLERQG